ncbi:Bacterial Ig-like domain (group 2) [compost metagenome]
MKYDGSSWSYLGGAGITPGTATYNSLALAANGDVFYSHQLGWPASGLSVQKYNGTSWTTLPAAESATVNFQSITTNGNNQPVVAYSSGGNLHVKSFDGTNWTTLGTGLPSGVPNYIDAKCVNGTVYIGFVNSGMKVYKIPASASATDSWTEVGTTSFGATSSEQFRSAITVDSNNDVFIAFTSPSGGQNRLNVKKYDHLSGQWSDVGSPNFTDYRVHYVDIALDNSHTPYVAFSYFENSPNNRNFVMKFDGTAWTTLGNWDVSGAEAKWNSLVISNNKPVLAYSDEPNDAVMVKEFLSPGCTNTLPGTAIGSTGCITFNYRNQPVTYTTVRAADGNVWLQQNLGSSQVATAANDASAYGDYFQWGRWDDGHQLSTSPLTATSPSPNNPAGLGSGNTNFYSAGYMNSNNWWTGGVSTDTWTAATPADASATNGCDPCKAMGADWRLPTTAELEGIISAENITNLSSAFASNLKIVGSGMKDYSGMFVDGTRAYLWSGSASSVDGWGETVYISPNVAISNYGGRDGGMPLRCLKANPVASSIDVATQNNVPATITTNAGTLQMTATILPAGVNQDVTWSIVPASGSATISATGLVTAQSNGTVWAKAVAVANPTLKDSMEITISGQIVSIISLDVQTQNNVAAVITTNGGTVQTIAIITPANTTNQDVTWSIVNGTGSATISATGLVTAQTNGTVWAKAVSVENTAVKDSLLITISGQLVSMISLDVQTQNNVSPVIITDNGTLQVIAVITPANTSNQNVTWSMVNGTGAATISASGLVTAQGNGTVWTKAVSVENTTVKDSLLITISGQSSAGINDQNVLSVNFYPNPVQKLLTVEVALPEGTALPVQLIDASGRLVYSDMLRSKKSQLDLGSLPAGTYRLIINNTYNQQLIIE